MKKKGKLYTANKWNLPLFASNKNLFYGGGNTWYSNFDWNSTFGSPTAELNKQENLSNAISGIKPQGINVSGANATANIPSKIETPDSLSTSAPKSTSNFNWGNFGKTAGGLASMIPENEMTIGNTTFKRGLWDAGDPLYYVAKGRESGVGNALGNLGVSVTKTGASSGMGWLALAGAGLKAAGDIDNAVAGTKTDEDTLDTLNRTTAALNSFNSEAGSYEGLVRPSGMVNYQDVYEGPGKNADIWAGMIGYLATGIPWAGTAYARRSRKAREETERKNNELRRNYENAQAWAENSYQNNLYNIQQDQMNNALRHYSAYGGPIETMPMYNNDMPAVNYDFMTDYLTAKKKQAEQKNTDLSNLFAGMPSTMFARGGKIHINPKNKGKFNATKKRTGKTTEQLTHSKNPLTRKRAIFAQNARKWHHADGGPLNVLYQLDDRILALGGDIQTHGGDFTTGLTRVDAGSSHELNPNEGVQMGVDQNGVPNLVEEGETVFNDYVYSNRIMVDDDTKKRYGINKKRQITFAELSKKLEKEASERPNDPISQAGLNASMSDLADAQEAEKMRLEAERAKEAFNSLSPEEQTALMQRAAQEQQVAQGAAVQQQMQQVPTEQEVLAQQQMADGSEAQVAPIQAACGGKINRFDDGGHYDLASFIDLLKAYNGSNQLGNTPNTYRIDTDFPLGEYASIEDLEASEGYKAYTNALLALADKMKGIKFKKKNEKEPLSIDNIEFKDKNSNITGEDVELLRALIRTAGRTPNTNTVSLLKRGDDDWNYLADDTSDIISRLRNDKKGGVFHLTPNWIADEPQVLVQDSSIPDGETQVYIATDKGVVPVDASTLDDSYTIEDFDGVKIARKAPQKVEETPAQTKEEIVAEETGIKPDLKKETYMGLFGPAVGLGMMSAGIGRPNYRELDAALTSARTAPRRAGYATIGDYLRYTPMDIWAEQNRLDANTRAADRALMAGNSPSRYAGILANNYNAQLASGDLYRKAVEYNDAKKAQVADFNRGTNQYNADAFTRNSQFNAESANRANQFATSVALNVAQQKMANEADWYNSLYGNVYGLFDRVNQWEKWKRDHNTVAQMYANGLAGVVDEDTPVAMGYVKKGAKGGKLRKKGKNDLTL